MKNKFNPMKTRFRATFSGAEFGAKRLGEIDEQNGVLHDVQITLEGEAKGHGVWLDREFCEAVAAAGNATGEVGLKVRYGHPAMCADAIGTELARAKNFRVAEFEREIDGERVTCAGVIADVHLLESAKFAPQGDLVAHVLAVAKEDPGQFGQSIVFTYADFKPTDANGKEIRCSEFKNRGDFYEAAGENKIFAVLGKLHGTDFTDTPAATDGVFSTGTLAEEAEQMLEEHPQILEVLEQNPRSVVEFLERTGLADKVESARVSGMQAAKDREIGELKAAHEAAVKEFEGQIESLRAELDAAKAEASAAQEKFEQTAKELDAAKGELSAANERLTTVESAHRKLTGGTLTIEDSALSGAKTFGEFVKDHGGDFSRAVREDPETYKRLCAARGCEPVALRYV